MCKISFLSKQLQLLLIIIIAAGILISSLHYAKELNMYHGELDIYLPHYLENKSVLKIVFDPICELDLSQKTFRGREVGNFFNFIDAKLLTYLFRIKMPALISMIYYVSVAIIIISVIFICSKIYKNREVLTGLLLLLLLSSPPIVLGGFFYRTNKIIAASAVVICIFILELIKKKVLKSNDQIFFLPLLFFISLIACLSDEQGFILIAIISFWELFVLAKHKKNYNFKISVFILFISVIFSICYKGFIGPEIFEKVMGIKVSTSNIGNLQTLTNVNNFFSSFFLLIKYISYVFGNLNPLITSFFGLILITKLYLKSYSEKFLHVVYILLMLTAVIHIMTLMHPAILWTESITYYSLPIICLIFAYSFIGLQNNIRLFGKEYLPYYFLMVLIVLNIFSWNKSFDKIANGHIKPFRVADKIISAVYDSEDQTKKTLAEISLKTASPGYIPEFKFGENGISALKQSLPIKKER